jgi:hypothetical protein
MQVKSSINLLALLALTATAASCLNSVTPAMNASITPLAQNLSRAKSRIGQSVHELRGGKRPFGFLKAENRCLSVGAASDESPIF